MTTAQDKAIARSADHENLVGELVETLESLLTTSTLVKYQADNSGKTPYTDWSSAFEDLKRVQAKARAILAKAREGAQS
jgi:hypothetical protein